MPQPLAVRAFRKRAQNLGYYDITIIKVKTREPVLRYRITAREPLAQVVVTAEYDITTLPYLMRYGKRAR